MITQKQIKKLFKYSDGNLIRLVTTSSNSKKGSIVGGLNSGGYLQVSRQKKHYLVHRLIFLMFNGYLPEIVDHIDGNPLNNKIENLRAATPTQSAQNQKVKSNSSTGVKGVFWRESHKRYIVMIRVCGVRKYLGSFEKRSCAEKAVMEERALNHKEFCNHGLTK